MQSSRRDRVTAEMMKDCAEMLAPKYEELFNKIFEFHEEPIDIKKGLMISIPKPHKPKTIENRPITILTTTRKIFPLIILGRIRKKALKFCYHHNQPIGQTDQQQTMSTY